MTLSSPLSDCCSAPVTFVESTPKYTNYKCSRCGRNPCDLQPPAVPRKQSACCGSPVESEECPCWSAGCLGPNHRCKKCGRTCYLKKEGEKITNVQTSEIGKDDLIDAVARIALSLQSIDPALHKDFLLILESRRSLEEKLSVAVGCLTAIKKELGSYHKDKMHIYDSYTHGLCSDTLNRVSACLSKILPPT